MAYYQNNQHRRGLLGHFSFGVQDMSISGPFYTAIFEPFGIELIYKSANGYTLGYGLGDEEPFTLFQYPDAKPHGKGTHLAFNAPSRLAVDKFYEAALKKGGRGDGLPGLRKDVHENYYCCFVYDPDGHRLEAVFQDPEEI